MTEPEKEEPITLTGFGLLKEMTKEQLIEELIDAQRKNMQESGMENLRANVIELRVNEYRSRLTSEAGLVHVHGILGTSGYVLKDDDDDENS